jgi:hypothetical protein
VPGIAAAAPPSYNEATCSSSSGSNQSPAPLPPASNFIYVHRANGAIKGTWVIDTGLKVPEDLLSPRPTTGERENLSLTTYNGEIKADVAFVSEKAKATPEKATRANILADTKNGAIKINFVPQSQKQENDQPFRAVLKTLNGAIHVQLPRSFTGPIKHHTSNGSYVFSSEMQKRLKAISSECSFLGSWEESGFVDYEMWSGYELDASTSNGSIKFSYYDEESGSSKKQGGGFLWFKW